jgi:NAD-dependent dihydropyrimidine dehydrogenase PreA subunit
LATLTDEMKDIIHKNHAGLIATVDEFGNPDLVHIHATDIVSDDTVLWPIVDNPTAVKGMENLKKNPNVTVCYHGSKCGSAIWGKGARARKYYKGLQLKGVATIHTSGDMINYEEQMFKGALHPVGRLVAVITMQIKEIYKFLPGEWVNVESERKALTVSIEIDDEKCNGCGDCVEICPCTVYELKNEQAVVVDIDACTDCRLCEKQCPTGAISVSSAKN